MLVIPARNNLGFGRDRYRALVDGDMGSDLENGEPDEMDPVRAV